MNLAELRLFKPLPACLWVLSILPFSHLFFRFYSTTDKRRKKKGKKKMNKEYPEFLDIQLRGENTRAQFHS